MKPCVIIATLKDFNFLMAAVLLLLRSLKPDSSGDQWAQIMTHIFRRIFHFIADASWQLSTQLMPGCYCLCSGKDSSVSSFKAANDTQRIQVYKRTPEGYYQQHSTVYKNKVSVSYTKQHPASDPNNLGF